LRKKDTNHFIANRVISSNALITVPI